jgi:hypothetical protein
MPSDTPTLVERLLEPDWHDPACPFRARCYCGDDGTPPPHDRVIHPLAREAANRIEALEAALRHIRDADPGPVSNQSLAHDMARVAGQSLGGKPNGTE